MITLVPMISDEFQQYLSDAVKGYAAEHVKVGNWNEADAIQKATHEYNTLLPDGEKTENNYMYTIRFEDKAVGMIWLAKKSDVKGFIYDIHILEEYQGRGFGKKAMLEIEEVGRKLGLEKIGLHVFGHNKRALGLYEKIGYQVTNVNMEKNI